MSLHRRSMQMLFASILLAISAVAISEVPRAQPAEVGLSGERLAQLDALYGEKVKKGELAGIVLIVSRHGKVAHFVALGDADKLQGKKLQTNSIFRWYSMTKAITATALMMLYEDGRLQLS